MLVLQGRLTRSWFLRWGLGSWFLRWRSLRGRVLGGWRIFVISRINRWNCGWNASSGPGCRRDSLAFFTITGPSDNDNHQNNQEQNDEQHEQKDEPPSRPPFRFADLCLVHINPTHETIIPPPRNMGTVPETWGRFRCFCLSTKITRERRTHELSSLHWGPDKTGHWAVTSDGMMVIQYEKPFETEICSWLDEHGWFYTDTSPCDELYDPATRL